MATAPEEVSSSALFWSVPTDEHFPAELHGRPIVVIAGVFSGPADEGERLMQPLRELATPLLDLSARETYVALQSGFDPYFPAGQRYYWKSLYVDQLSDALIDELARRAAERPSALSTIDIWHQGGAMSRVGADATAFGRRDAPFLLSFSSGWTAPDDTDANVAWARDGWAAIHRYSSDGGVYLNFPGLGEEQDALVRASYGANFPRLVALKSQYDPTNLFRFNQNIRPSPATADSGE
jgi:FAD/FMN-containing dehydrogenase